MKWTHVMDELPGFGQVVLLTEETDGKQRGACSWIWVPNGSAKQDEWEHLEWWFPISALTDFKARSNPTAPTVTENGGK